MSETEDIYNEGWVSIHRKSIRSSVFDDPLTWKVWTWCLMKASHTEHEFILGTQAIDQKIGEFVTGRKSACKELKTTDRKYRSRIELLTKTGRISVKTTNKYSVITVVKYEHYQGEARKTTNKRPTNDQQTTTINNGNTDNNQQGEEISPKDMSGFNKIGDDPLEDDVQIDPDFKPKEKKKRNYREVYKLFFEILNTPPLSRADWVRNTTEQKSADDLYAHKGLEQVEKALTLYTENKDTEFCPKIYSPNSLARKWKQLHEFKEKNNL